MTDRRRLAFSGRVAHVSLRGQVAAASFTEGAMHRVLSRTLAIRDRPGGARLRELLFGADFLVIDRQDGAAFGARLSDGYAGWVDSAALAPAAGAAPTHRVVAARTLALSRPDATRDSPHVELSLGARLVAGPDSGGWTPVGLPTGQDQPAAMFVPTAHLAELGRPARDPAAEAERLLGTPYLWGGNSAFGLDCSGLIDAAFTACAVACPGDSDMQAAELGAAVAADAPVQRGDLFFWKGHVAMATGPDMLIHANAHHMAVAAEPLAEATARIAAQGGGPVTGRRRVSLSPG